MMMMMMMMIAPTISFTASRIIVRQQQRIYCSWKGSIGRYERRTSFFLSTSSLSSSSSLFSSSSLSYWNSIMKDAVDYLQQGNVPEPEESVFQLLAWTLQLNWEDGHSILRKIYWQKINHQKSSSSLSSSSSYCLELLGRKSMTFQEMETFQSFLQRRYSMEPIQYILGQWDFLDHTFWIEPPLLCPRPETEELVLLAEHDLRSQLYPISSTNRITPQRPLSILDIGCGTGVIGISLVSRLSNLVQVDAIDIDPLAVSVSQRNAQRILGAEWNRMYRVTHQTICQPLTIISQEHHPYDMIVSNPPYIPQPDMTTLSKDVINYESHTALCGGMDGMDIIRSILDQLPTLCRSGAICWMEVDPTHPCRIKEAIQQNPNYYSKIQFDSSHKDMFGNPRFVKLLVQ
jgi:release factor glutamine methyltransferase